MQIHIIPVTMFQSNTVIIWDEETMEGLVADPGGDPERVNRFLNDQGITVKGIFLTHGHVDHVSGTNRIKEETGAEVWIHPADKPLADQTAQQCMMFGIPTEQAPEVDNELADGGTHSVGSLTFEVLHTPGHSPGSCCFYFAGDEPVLVAGDLLFAGSIGRMDLPGGNQEKMKESLSRITQLPDDVSVIPGHGPKTTIGREKTQNPYLAGGLLMW
jgi:hydroxyacylglutathione hydrolase